MELWLSLFIQGVLWGLHSPGISAISCWCIICGASITKQQRIMEASRLAIHTCRNLDNLGPRINDNSDRISQPSKRGISRTEGRDECVTMMTLSLWTLWIQCGTHSASEVHSKMIFMGYQKSSCHILVVRSFFILWKMLLSSLNLPYDHISKFTNITLQYSNKWPCFVP